MMSIIINGILSGIVLAFLIGPVFFTILQTSMERGFKKGVLVALGVSLSDASYIILTYLGISQLMDNPQFRTYLAYLGGIVLVSFGIYYILVKSRKPIVEHGKDVGKGGVIRYLAKGFIINGLSPLVLVFWIGTVGFATTELGYIAQADVITYFGAILITVLVTDILKAKLADKLRLVITPKFIKVLNISLGLLFVVAGGRLIFYSDNLLSMVSLHLPN